MTTSHRSNDFVPLLECLECDLKAEAGRDASDKPDETPVTNQTSAIVERVGDLNNDRIWSSDSAKFVAHIAAGDFQPGTPHSNELTIENSKSYPRQTLTE